MRRTLLCNGSDRVTLVTRHSTRKVAARRDAVLIRRRNDEAVVFAEDCVKSFRRFEVFLRTAIVEVHAHCTASTARLPRTKFIPRATPADIARQ